MVRIAVCSFCTPWQCQMRLRNGGLCRRSWKSLVSGYCQALMPLQQCGINFTRPSTSRLRRSATARKSIPLQHCCHAYKAYSVPWSSQSLYCYDDPEAPRAICKCLFLLAQRCKQLVCHSGCSICSSVSCTYLSSVSIAIQ